MSLLSLKSLSKRFGTTAAVTDVSISVERGEFFGLLGPSGCGKTTTLRIIAGLESPDMGNVEFEGHEITSLPSEKRGFGMVFQNYALFPHLNVFENVAFGLRARGNKVSSGSDSDRTIPERVQQALELVQLPGFDRRRVDELSGGQQQRVAIARAIAIEPSLLLFDEPLSNLDVALREETRRELRALVKRLGLTAVYVTHDQEEAFALCDRIAVMGAGSVLQIGAPHELYDRPANGAVATFLGNNNLIAAMRLTSTNDPVTKFKTIDGGHTLIVQASHDELMALPVNKPCRLAIRPEAIELNAKPGTDNQLAARIELSEFGGATTMLRLDANGLKVEALVLSADEFAIGDECLITLPVGQIRLLPSA
ncbi:MAG: putative spermidine/putrescine transport system ATP-binding protein [Blastocatellia bacterium]|jgi:iron(III) transport system ATP-binding protein|nr:putative spermidine/putrescine transport system ATP-binding protein [Blastocatellia bacterium]